MSCPISKSRSSPFLPLPLPLSLPHHQILLPLRLAIIIFIPINLIHLCKSFKASQSPSLCLLCQLNAPTKTQIHPTCCLIIYPFLFLLPAYHTFHFMQQLFLFFFLFFLSFLFFFCFIVKNEAPWTLTSKSSDAIFLTDVTLGQVFLLFEYTVFFQRHCLLLHNFCFGFLMNLPCKYVSRRQTKKHCKTFIRERQQQQKYYFLPFKQIFFFINWIKNRNLK